MNLCNCHSSLCFVSDNVERREIEKERLQHELRVCDEKLNRQVEGKNQETKIKSCNARTAPVISSLSLVRNRCPACLCGSNSQMSPLLRFASTSFFPVKKEHIKMQHVKRH